MSQWKWRSCRRKPAGGSWFSRNRDVVKIPFSPHEFKMNPGFGMPPGAWLYEILYFAKPLGLIRWWWWMKAPNDPPICSAQIVPGVRPSCRLFAYVSGHRAPGEANGKWCFFCVSTPEVLVRQMVFFFCILLPVLKIWPKNLDFFVFKCESGCIIKILITKKPRVQSQSPRLNPVSHAHTKIKACWDIFCWLTLSWSESRKFHVWKHQLQ